MIPKSLEHRILLKGDLRKTGSLIDLNVVGASTSTLRNLFETDSARIIYLDTINGSNGNSGEIGFPVFSPAYAISLINGTTKFVVEVVNDGAFINENLTVPFQASLGILVYYYNGGSLLNNWNPATVPSFSTTNINDMAYNSELSRAVAVADSGKIGYSDDGGDNWTQVTSTFGGTAIHAITKANKFIAVGASGKIGFSDTGLLWQQAVTPSFGSDNINGVTYSQTYSRAVAVGDNGKIAISTDNGNTWAQVPTPGFGTDILRAITEINGVLIVCSESTGKIGRSTDGGDTWTLVTSSFAGTDTIRDACSGNGTLIAVGNDVSNNDKIAYSLDEGVTWTQTTPNFGSVNVLGCTYSNSLNLFLAVGESDKVGYSPDGIVWKLGADTSGSLCILSADDLFKVITAGMGGDISFAEPEPITISDSLCGFIIGYSGAQIEIDSAALLYSNTWLSKPDMAALAETNANRFASGLDIATNEFTLLNDLIIGDMVIDSVPADLNDAKINNCTIIGDIDINNTGQDAEGFQIQDNIIEGNITAEETVVMQSGNIRGTVENVSLLDVSSDDPLFLDTIDYKLRYAILGYDFDSSLVHASKFSFRPDGVARDYGAYNIDDSQLVDLFCDSAWLTRPNSIQILPQAESWTDKGLSGEIDGFNDIKMLSEEVILTWNGMYRDVYNFFTRQNLRANTKLFLSLYPNKLINISPIVLSAPASQYAVTLDIDATTIYFGDVLRIDEQQYFVLYSLNSVGSKSSSDAVKLILDRPLHTALADNATIERRYPTGFGEYSYKVEQQQPFAMAGLNGDVLYNISIRMVKNNGSNAQ